MYGIVKGILNKGTFIFKQFTCFELSIFTCQYIFNNPTQVIVVKQKVVITYLFSSYPISSK